MLRLRAIQQKYAPAIAHGARFWGYLDTAELNARYALAAHFLAGYENIVEIGGYCTDIAQWLHNPEQHKIWVYSLDLEFVPRQDQHYSGIREDFRQHRPPQDTFALCLLGYDLDDALQDFVEWVKCSRRIVFEGANGHQPFRSAVEQLQSLKMPLVAKIDFDYLSNTGLLKTPGIMPATKNNLHRSMYIWDNAE